MELNMTTKKISSETIQSINNYVFSQLDVSEMPLYCSVDVRDSGFKSSVVDTNLFPAGFNNLDKTNSSYISSQFKSVITQKAGSIKTILLIVESNTRNKWYLENVYCLHSYLIQAGYHVTLAAFLDEYSDACQKQGYVDLETYTGEQLKIECVNRIVDAYKDKNRDFDLIILNNDLMSGIPDLLTIFDIPILPKAHLGWHSRLKSNHFNYVHEILDDCSKTIDVDPWLLSCFHSTLDQVNIMDSDGVSSLAHHVQLLIDQIQRKYDAYNISDKPFVMVKANSGTYGMGVMNFESADDVLNMNRKTKNKLLKGKHSSLISSFLIQEGVSTRFQNNNKVLEPCLYYVGKNNVGGFLRTNELKNSRQNLNSLGMGFDAFDSNLDLSLDLYHCLAYISILAVVKEA